MSSSSNHASYCSQGDFKQGQYHYRGCFVHSKRQGKGTMQYPSGNVYTGEWHQNKQEGRGVLLVPGGDVYEGEWKKGMKHGRGKLSFGEAGERN